MVAFADDTAFIYKFSSWIENFQSPQFSFNRVMKWLITNTLSLNVDKTNLLTIKIKNSNWIPRGFDNTAHNQDAKMFEKQINTVLNLHLTKLMSLTG